MTRIESVDTFRFLAITAVIVIHTGPFHDWQLAGENRELYRKLALFLNQISSFAVPFFFVISGYFFGMKIRNGADIRSHSMKVLKRLFVLFIAWSLIYLLLPYDSSLIPEYGILGPIKGSYWRMLSLASDPVTLIFEGTAPHLWFLVALGFAVASTGLFTFWGLNKSLVVVAVALYIFGLLASSYAHSPFGIEINFNTRDGPFFGTIFFATGYCLSKHEPTPRWLLLGSLLFMMGVVIHFSEIHHLCKFSRISPCGPATLLGTYFMGTGISILALSNHSLIRNTQLGFIGRYTLGIYLVHFIFVVIFWPIGGIIFNPIWELGYVAIVLLLSIGTTFLLSKNKYTKALVV